MRRLAYRARATLAALTFALTLAACKREPDFNERYEAASAKVTQTAREIDDRIAATGVPEPDAPDGPGE
ncbi:hypothetical protein [Novosphingobium mangrovi (ex Huang et al. 2023)]|uniref:Lipoprotein n=1 Tax=Novosphingobium mangrovi (ex Huang et al. 2023) TaxID=2976432 RepID=A0ABT2I8C7_9SPHN|nr:hypothetical protein [Novosphingobium mangrovi (ex Huang et al. 2023)]MCT2401075.1 hypothetical protein [Novosphingobium mangrovi (ex Huang et al. 2023)]